MWLEVCNYSPSSWVYENSLPNLWIDLCIYGSWPSTVVLWPCGPVRMELAKIVCIVGVPSLLSTSRASQSPTMALAVTLAALVRVPWLWLWRGCGTCDCTINTLPQVGTWLSRMSNSERVTLVPTMWCHVSHAIEGLAVCFVGFPSLLFTSGATRSPTNGFLLWH